MGCCALTFVFGAVTATAHVHGPGDHHAESRGLHLDHGHLSRSSNHDHHHGHHHGHDHGGAPSHATVHIVAGEHHHDGLYLNEAAARSVGSSVRAAIAMAAPGPVLDAPSTESKRKASAAAVFTDPPDKIPPRLRAPPA